MLKDRYPYYIAGEPILANRSLEVRDKFTGEVATTVALADEEAIELAIDAAVRATQPMRDLKAYERQAVLMHCVERFEERYEELAESLCIEAGKPIKDSRGEVTRLIDTFRLAAEESVRQLGEIMPLDVSALVILVTVMTIPLLFPSLQHAFPTVREGLSGLSSTATCGSACRSGRARSSRRSTSRSTSWPTRWRLRWRWAARSCSSLPASRRSAR